MQRSVFFSGVLLIALTPVAHAIDDVAPLIDAQTFVVARIDVDRINPDAWIDLIARFVPAEDLDPARNTAKAWLDTYRKRGGREVNILYGLADAPDPPCLITPVAGDLNRGDLAEMLKMLTGRSAEHARIGKLLVVGPKRAVERLKTRKPEARSELVEAFAAAGDGVARIALAMPADMRRVFEETLDELPAELGGGSVRLLTRDIRWLAVSLNAPPKLGIRMVVQAADADAALRLKELMSKLLALASKAPAPISDQPLAKVYPKLVQRLTELLTPEVQKDRLIVNAELGPELPDFMKLTEGVRGAARQSKSQNNLRQLGIAMHNYHDTYGFLPTDIRDNDGKPLLSWRVAILPYIEQENLYRQFKLDEPWDSEHNRKLIAKMPEVLRSPMQGEALKDRTTYLAPTGKGLIWDEPTRRKRGPPFWQGLSIRDIVDGTSNTILLVETNDEQAVPWTKPADLPIDPKEPSKGLLGHYADGFLILFGDGSARLLRSRVKGEVLYWMFTRAGGEVIPND